MASNPLARGSGQPLILDLIQKMQPEIKKALPNLGITPERMIRMSLTCLRNTPKLLECEQQTVLAGIVELAQLGLEPSTPLGHAWLIPFGRRAQVVIGYKGFISLADRAGIAIGADVVYSGDHFNYPRPGETVIDYIPFDGDDKDRGERKYAFAYALRKDRPLQFKVCTRADIQRAREASSAVKNNRKDSPWFGDERGNPSDVDAMWRKTAIRRLAPFLPMSAEMTAFTRAIELDDATERGVEQAFDLSGVDVRNEVRADDIEKRLHDEKQ